ncbi:MAG: hypothetical protein F8N39_19450 [Clostridiaceae bacterium]|nr:hypothetical protein [Clostridiaceae bacterium]
MANEMGRPKNYTTEEIKNIINLYVDHTGGTVLLNASKIAKYANDELGLPNFKYYAINRNKETKQHLKDLNDRIIGVSDKKLPIIKSVFTQIDVNSYLSMKEDDLKVALQNLNVLIEDMANANTELIKENVKLKTKIQEKDIELRRLNEKISEANKEYDKGLSNSKGKVDEQKQKIQDLSAKVRQQDDLIHMLWDREAEKILMQKGIFENDGVELNENRIISDVYADITKVAKEVNDNFSNIEVEKISNKFIERIKNI